MRLQVAVVARNSFHKTEVPSTGFFAAINQERAHQKQDANGDKNSEIEGLANEYELIPGCFWTPAVDKTR